MLRELSPSELDDLDTFSRSFKSKKLERLLIDNDDGNGSNDGNSQSTQNCKQIVQEYRRLSFQDSTNDVFPENSILRVNHKFRDCFNGFDFCLKKDDNNEITGGAWQTGFMRNNFSRYGSYASIDACKRDYCSCGLHYMSVSLRRADGSICVAIEALLESEDIATYSWMWSCLFLMSDDNMSREDVRVVAADQSNDQTEKPHRRL